MILHEPQTVEELHARYPEALRDVFDVEAVIFSGCERPGERRANVFDFDDGTRLVVSRERDGEGVFLHVSASAMEGSETYERIRSVQILPYQFLNAAMDKFRAISGDGRKLEFLGFTMGRGVPHWVCREGRS